MQKNLSIALGDLSLVEDVQIHGLFETEQMLQPKIAVQRAGDGSLIIFATAITQAGENQGVTLAIDNGLDDPHSRCPSDIGDHVGKLEVHLGQGLLHMLDVRGGIAHQIHPLPNIGTQGTDLIGRAKSTCKQAIGVQLL